MATLDTDKLLGRSYLNPLEENGASSMRPSVRVLEQIS
jgi:hypothetical protein